MLKLSYKILKYSIIFTGADVNVKSNWLKMNCFHLCAFYDSHKCLEYLLNETSCVGK